MGSRSSVKMWQQRFTDAKFLLSAVTILAMLAPDIASAAVYRYWKGASGDDWNVPCNWSWSETGDNCVVGPPTGSGVAVFTSNIGTRGSGSNLILATNINIGGLILAPSFTGRVLTGTASITISGTGVRIGSGRLQLGSAVLSTSGSIVMTGGILSNSSKSGRLGLSGSLLHRGGTLSYSGGIVFTSKNADQTLRTTLNETVSATYKYAKATLSGITLNNTAGTTIDDLLITGATLLLKGVTITRGNLDLARYGVNLSLSGSMDIASNAQAGFNASTQTLTLSGSIQRGANGYFNLSGGTLVLNGGVSKRQAIAANNTKVANFTVTKASSGVLVENITVLGSLTINTGSLLAFGANTLYATGSSIVNYGQIKEDTGKIYHTGSNMVVGN
ncbi:hypothetical protein HYW11_01625, partial [Candidatus Peregrinibacteria bacterium]|nr:hypothetical protein [Candidatus Peregrinibacteria bacterium]